MEHVKEAERAHQWNYAFRLENMILYFANYEHQSARLPSLYLTYPKKVYKLY